MSSARPIHQLVHTLSYGDAISTEVLTLQAALRALGVESEIYALHEHNLLKGRSRQASVLGECPEADLILHYSIGSPLNELFASWNRGHRILVYHNITPAEWYDGVNNRVAGEIRKGIADLPALCALSDRIWADSRFNAEEISRLGWSAQVLDLPIAPERWSRPRDERLFKKVSRERGAKLLHVGRLAPNKCLEDVIKSFYFLRRFVDTSATLRIVGIDADTELYSFSLRRLVRALGIDHCVHFTGGLSDEEVRALYEASTLYLCMSEHEGFCLPLIEAMHFGLPVVAFAAGAVGETVGGGGVLVREKRHAEIGVLLGELSTNLEARQRVIDKGRARVASFSFERFQARVRELLMGRQKQQEREALGA